VSPNLTSLFNLHACASLDKFLHLLDIIQGQPWKYESESGRVIFGDAMSFQAQVLGYEAMDTRSWLWSWTETGVEFPDAVTKSARSLKSYGEKKDIPEFVSPQCPLTTVTGEKIAMVACGLFNAQAYFRGPYAGGAMLLAILDPEFPSLQTPPVDRILQVFPRAVFSYGLDHQRAFLAYTRHYQLDDFEEGGVTVIADGKRELIEAEFDEQGRLLTLRSLVPKAQAERAAKGSDLAVPPGKPKKVRPKPGRRKGSSVGSGLEPAARQRKGSGVRSGSAPRSSERRAGSGERRSRYRR